MKQTRILWDMPITIDINDKAATAEILKSVYDYFEHVDQIFSPFNPNSEISRLNRGEITNSLPSSELAEVLLLSEQTQQQTHGYFNIRHHGQINPVGLVKGWALYQASQQLIAKGFHNFYIDAGGDIQAQGYNHNGESWMIGIRNPFDRYQNIKILVLRDQGIATSGTAVRGQHIYDPFRQEPTLTDIVSFTVIGPNVYEADRFATAAFAMGKQGIAFIQSQPHLEGYQIDNRGIATYTSGFQSLSQSL